VILFVFLWNFRTTLTLAISIPFAIIAAFVAIYSAGYTLNIITLSGLALGIGMIVDNSIVVLENIFRHVQEGEDRMEAARAGATEVTMAITASTLTTVIVFLPMVFAQGMTGELTKPLGLTVTFALLASLLVALTLVPMVASRIFKEQPRQRGAGFFEAVKGRYMGVIRFALRHRALVVLGAIVIFVCSLYLIGRAGGEFMPKLDEMYSTAMLRLPPGTSLEETSRFVGKIEKAVMEEPEFRSIISMTGLTDSSKFDLAMGAGSGSVNESTIYYEIAPKTQRERTGIEFMEMVRSKLPELAEGSMYFMQTTDYFTLGGERPVSVKLFGPDLGVLKERSDLLKERMAQIEGVVDLDNSLKMGKPELQVEVDRDKASSMGISVSQVANTIETAFLGREITKYREAGDEHDIRVRFSERDRESWSDLEDVLLTSPQGFLVNLSDVATVKEGRGPVKIDREDQERVAIVSADAFGRDVGSIMAELGSVFGEVPLPEGYYFQLGGSLEDMQEMMVTMVWTISLIILLVFMVMASQFESLFHPLSIIAGVPFAIIGVALALILTGTTLSVMSFIGIMMLVGIVVNNGIVLIDYINQLRARGMERSEAIVQGGATRLRPILMTTLTTVLALIPMAISRGEGAELFSPIAITIFGGLLTSMLLTLIVMPTIYSLVDDVGQRVRRIIGKQV
jgi:HAE1 family hydrophobic/amphiphilic exporter-1